MTSMFCWAVGEPNPVFQMQVLPQYLPQWPPSVPPPLSPPQQVSRANASSLNGECKAARLPTGTSRAGGRAVILLRSWCSWREGTSLLRGHTVLLWTLLVCVANLLHRPWMDEEPTPYIGQGLWVIPVVLLRSPETNFENSHRISLSLF